VLVSTIVLKKTRFGPPLHSLPGGRNLVVPKFWVFNMMRFARWLAPVGVLFLAIAFGVRWSEAELYAQGKTRKEGPEFLRPEKNLPKEKEFERFQRLRRGEAAVSRTDESLLDHAAQWYAYRLTDFESQDPQKSGSKPMHELVRDAYEQIIDPKKANANQQLYMEEFSKRLIVRLHDVMKTPKPIARVNAAMILERLAEYGYAEAADVLVEAIQDPKESDAVRLFAFRGLKKLFSLEHGDAPRTFKAERRDRWVQALINYLSSKPAVQGDATPEELAAVGYVRREAVAALGQTRHPAVAKRVNQKVSIDRPAALVLLRIVTKDGVTPEPTLTEQVDAMVGLCRLRWRLCEGYQADYAAYHIGRFLVEFNKRYNEEKEEKKEPWKIHAARLSKGLSDLVADLTGPPKDHDHVPYVEAVVKQIEPLLEQIIIGKNPQTDPTRLNAWLDANPPKSTSLYKDLPTAVVNPPKEKGAEEK
jgi:hypothetical protein